jgi:hypothetical protein
MAHLYASFSDALLAEKAAGALLDYGVYKDDISLVANDMYEAAHAVGDFAAAASPPAASSIGTAGAAERTLGNPPASAGPLEEGLIVRDFETAAKEGISTTTPEDAGQGAVTGAEIGLGIGILAGLAVLLVPGVGLVMGGGALASAIGGAALTAGAGAIVGGVTGYLKEMGVPGEAAQQYQGVIDNGGAVLNILLPSGNVDQATAEQVLAKYHAEYVRSY